MRRQEREHAPRRHQVPDQRPRVQELPARPLSALHAKIIPEDRTLCRYRSALFSGLLATCRPATPPPVPCLDARAALVVCRPVEIGGGKPGTVRGNRQTRDALAMAGVDHMSEAASGAVPDQDGRATAGGGRTLGVADGQPGAVRSDYHVPGVAGADGAQQGSGDGVPDAQVLLAGAIRGLTERCQPGSVRGHHHLLDAAPMTGIDSVPEFPCAKVPDPQDLIAQKPRAGSGNPGGVRGHRHLLDAMWGTGIDGTGQITGGRIPDLYERTTAGDGQPGAVHGHRGRVDVVTRVDAPPDVACGGVPDPHAPFLTNCD